MPNGNYLWINMFATSLNKNGRAALVMANSASDAGNSEKDIRINLIESGMIKPDGHAAAQFASMHIINLYYLSICADRNTGVWLMDYISVREASQKWNISIRRVQKLCEDNRIEGVVRFGRFWMIPKAAEKPADPRKARARKESK